MRRCLPARGGVVYAHCRGLLQEYHAGNFDHDDDVNEGHHYHPRYHAHHPHCRGLLQEYHSGNFDDEDDGNDGHPNHPQHHTHHPHCCWLVQ